MWYLACGLAATSADPQSVADGHGEKAEHSVGRTCRNEVWRDSWLWRHGRERRRKRRFRRTAKFREESKEKASHQPACLRIAIVPRRSAQGVDPDQPTSPRFRAWGDRSPSPIPAPAADAAGFDPTRALLVRGRTARDGGGPIGPFAGPATGNSMSAGRRSHRREVGRPLGSSVRAQGVAGGHFEVADAARRVRIHGGGLCPYWAESGMAAPGQDTERSGHSFPGGRRPIPAQNQLAMMGVTGLSPLRETHSRLSGLWVDFGYRIFERATP